MVRSTQLFNIIKIKDLPSQPIDFHAIVINKKHIKRILTEYLFYYHNDRTCLGLSKDTPIIALFRPGVEKNGKLIALSRVGVLNHWYESVKKLFDKIFNIISS